ncbi:hypothetical protein ACEWY4_000241 [Coilia grayii]|uniref:Ig-like domain-containing protein n=1 Tax=Coilia grayii TaxID=363190 RepID=A0ABD1KW32_9TELE
MIGIEAFNGDSGDETYLSIADKTLEAQIRWPRAWTALQSEYNKWVIINLYQPVCMGALYDLLNQNRKYVRRKVKPRVRLLQKALPGTGGVKVTCLATGFYPRHINLTLLRDGQPVPDHQITGGELLPNGDGTYQMRKSLEASTEEVQHHQYTCTAQHLSLDNKLDIALEPRPGQNHVVVAVVMLTLVCLPVFIIFVFCRKRLKGSQKSKEDVKEESEETPQEEEPDGQAVPDHQITGGELLPNGDGTYQMRKSLEVSTEEVQHHQYTCTAQHLSLDNKLDISLEPRPGRNHVVVAVVMLTLVCLPVFIIFVFCRKRIKVKPRLLQNTLPDSGGLKVTCLATGFYPRHINLTLLRDGQPVPDHQITGGELLPNGDGTYQMRKSLEVSTEEVQHHQYTCTAQHLSLDNKLDIPLEPRPGQNHVVVAVVVLTLFLVLGFLVLDVFVREVLMLEFLVLEFMVLEFMVLLLMVLEFLIV